MIFLRVSDATYLSHFLGLKISCMVRPDGKLAFPGFLAVGCPGFSQSATPFLDFKKGHGDMKKQGP